MIVLTTAAAVGQCGLQTNGLFMAESPDNPEFKTYLRFFEDGTVLIADSKSDFDEVKVWMEKGRETIMETEYEMNKKCKLEYELELEIGKVKYSADVTGTGTLTVTRSAKGYGDIKIKYEFVAVEFDDE